MAKKRGSGEGSIYKYPNGWRGQVYLGNKRVSFTGRTKTEVVKKIAEARADFNRGQFVFDSDVTLKEWFENWLETYMRPRVKEQSLYRYEGICRNHLIPQLGHYKLQDLTKEILEDYYKNEFTGVNGGKKYSKSIVSHIAALLKKSLQFAVQKRILVRNPHDGIELINLAPAKKVSAFTAEEGRKIVAYCKDGGRMDTIFYLLIATGMRLGEATSLTWDDIDLKNKTISINKTTVIINGYSKCQPTPKTSSGDRTISFSSNVGAFLERLYKENNAERNTLNLVFPNSRYHTFGHPTLTAHWKLTCERAGVEYKNIHSLRHTFATRALEEGVDVKTVSAMLGHKDVTTTMNTYQDVLPSQMEKAAEKLNNLF